MGDAVRIAVVNFSVVPDPEVLDAVRAVGRQVKEELAPRWSITADLDVAAPSGSGPDPEVLDGDAVIYICDDTDGSDVGYHERNQLKTPYGFVFTELAKVCQRPWSAVLSHEVLELLIDPQLNQFVAGPDPKDPSKTVMYLKEICDPVEDDFYQIDGIDVSNFVLPAYYSSGAPTSKTDRLASGVAPFGVNAGGYVEYVVPGSGKLRRFGGAMKVFREKERIAKSYRRSRRHAARRLVTKRKVEP